MGEVDDPFVKLLDGEIARIKRSTKMVPQGAALTRNGRDRQRHESTITTRERPGRVQICPIKWSVVTSV